MSNFGNYITHLLAVTFLSHDYEECLLIAKNNFSYIANSALFEGNLLRFFAIASCKAFQHAILDDKSEENYVENFGLLI